MTTDYNLRQRDESDEAFAKRSEQIMLSKLSSEERTERNTLLETNRQNAIDKTDLIGTVLDASDRLVTVKFDTGRRTKPNDSGKVSISKSNVYSFYPKPQTLTIEQLKNDEYKFPVRLDTKNIVNKLQGRLICLFDNPIPDLSAQTWVLVVDKKDIPEKDIEKTVSLGSTGVFEENFEDKDWTEDKKE